MEGIENILVIVEKIACGFWMDWEYSIFAL